MAKKGGEGRVMGSNGEEGMGEWPVGEGERRCGATMETRGGGEHAFGDDFLFIFL